ncbi:hypothetical protein D3C73_1198140 [compost metagenome]
MAVLALLTMPRTGEYTGSVSVLEGITPVTMGPPATLWNVNATLAVFATVCGAGNEVTVA